MTPNEETHDAFVDQSNIYIDSPPHQKSETSVNRTQAVSPDSGVNQAEEPATSKFELTQPVVDTSKASDKVVETSPSTTTPSLVIGSGQRVDYCGEEVTIVGWENGGSKVQVEFSNGRFQTVRKGALKPLKKK